MLRHNGRAAAARGQTVTDEAPRLPESSFPGLIPTMNTTGFMTEKLDGTSFTAFLRDEQFGICSQLE